MLRSSRLALALFLIFGFVSIQGSASVVSDIKKFITEKKIDTKKTGWKTNLPKFPTVKFDGKQKYFWVLETTVGTMKFRLFEDTAPNHVASTIYLTELGFYNDIAFHRIINRFMAQGGDPLGNGTGGPGYKYDGEFETKEELAKRGVKVSKIRAHKGAGFLSMANAGPGTDGSQFFVTFVPTPWLDGKHTLFGKLVDGMGVLKSLEAAGSAGGKPTKAIKIKKASIKVEGI